MDNNKIDLPHHNKVKMLKEIDRIGHGKIIDGILSDPRAEYHQICVHEKIVFDDPNDRDRDWK
eukprot:5009017-Ditylum_brightwellii.AAC.1